MKKPPGRYCDGISRGTGGSKCGASSVDSKFERSAEDRLRSARDGASDEGVKSESFRLKEKLKAGLLKSKLDIPADA
jgi:hypothetical protein